MSSSIESPPLSVALDVSAVPDRPAGAGTYTVELARALDRSPDARLTLLARCSDRDRWGAIAPSATHRFVAPDRLVQRLLWGERGLGKVVRSDRSIEVLHGPHYTMPADATVPVVVTVHDLTMVEHPEWHERSKVWVFGRALRLAAQRAAAVVCVSQRTADQFLERYSPRAPVVVIPHGIDHQRFTAHEMTPGADQAVLASLGIAWPYLLHLGTIEPRKDVPSLIAAFDRVAERDQDLRLVLAGQLGWRPEAFRDALVCARHAQRIVQLGYVEHDSAPALLRRSAAVAYPALEEGFGLPALEALACGVPVVTTADTVMADVVGNAGLVVPAHNVEALAEGIERALAANADQDERRIRGLAIAAHYTWDESARAHIACFRSTTAR